MGDLGVFITCPNGTVVSLVEWGVNGGGGTFLGEAIDDAGSDPGIGYTYNKELDAFIPPKPYASWLLDTDTGLWNAPIAKPEGNYSWNEDNQSWDLVPEES